VTVPPEPESFRAAKPGSVFAEFDVPEAQLKPGGDSGWGLVFGPNSNWGIIMARRGTPVDAMPEATNIELVIP